jgi:carbon monoxide dehydrogenase subunit G
VPSAVFEHTAVAFASQDEVWKQLQDPQTWQGLAGVEEVFDAHHDPDGLLTAYRFRVAAASQIYEGSATTVEATNPSNMAIDIVTSEVTGRISTTLSETAEGIAVNVHVALRSKGFLATLFFPVISQALGNGLPQQVDAFAARLA